MNPKTTGFASPAQGYEEQGIDLNRLYIQHPAATFFFRLASADMENLGIPKGSLLIVDRAVDPSPNSLVLFAHEGRFLCRLLVKEKGETKFTNGITDIIPISEDTEIFGTVTAYIATSVAGVD